jgi:hypothetical protein
MGYRSLPPASFFAFCGSECRFDAAQLFVENKNWKRCKLTGKEGELNLIELLQKFHQQMLPNYGGYVAKMFFPEWVPAIQFYAQPTHRILKKCWNDWFDPATRQG